MWGEGAEGGGSSIQKAKKKIVGALKQFHSALLEKKHKLFAKTTFPKVGLKFVPRD